MEPKYFRAVGVSDVWFNPYFLLGDTTIDGGLCLGWVNVVCCVERQFLQSSLP